MADEKTNYLPELKKDHKISLTKVGEWEEFSSIDDLADGLKVPEAAEGSKKADKDQIFSIPDPWARVILFTRALINDKHSAHARVLGEWRGLLAILALREIRKFSELIPAAVSLDFTKPGEKKPAKDSFLAMIGRVLPGGKNDLIVPSTTWKNFHILSWKSRTGGSAHAFAMTSPTTLVATGAYYARAMKCADVPWFRDPEFAPPLPPKNGVAADEVLLKGGVLRAPTAEDLSDHERVALAQWLLQVHRKLSEDGKGHAHATMLKRLEAFKKDIVEGLEIEDLDTDENRVLSEKRIGLTGAGPLFNLMDRPAKLEPEVLTNLLLVTRAETQQYVLLDESAAASLGQEPRDITFYKGISLSAAARHYALDVPSDAVDADGTMRYCTKDFFFQPDLVFILKAGAQADMLPRCRKVKVDSESHACAQQRQILFPMTADAARLFSPEELARRTKVKWVSGDEAIVSFEVDVRSVRNPSVRVVEDEEKTESSKASATPVSKGKIDERLVRVTISKRYIGDALHAVTKLPVIGVWPNVQFPEPTKNRWRRYFLFESWRGGANTAEKLVLRARPLDDREAVARMVKQGAYFQISRLSKFPEVLVCETPSEVEQQNRQDIVQGLLLPIPSEEERPPNVATRDAVLGVDFGTTGTSIYQAFFSGDGPGGKTDYAEAVLLKDRFVRVTASSDKELQHLTRELFVPAKEWSAAKILSVYQDLESSETTEGSAGPRLPVTHGHVLFADETDQGSFIPERQKDSVHSDLKWGEKEVVAKAARDFIAQLCLQCVLELACLGARSVEIRYSYPTAFNETDVFNFGDKWDRVIKEIQEVTSLTVVGSDDVLQHYEAVAAARYFREEEKLTAEGGALTLDIGGGTTDLALWGTVKNEPTLLSHSSVLFAGRDIFLAPIRRHPEVLSSIRNPNRSPEPVPDFLSPVEIKRGSSAFFALLDAHIQMYGDKLMGDVSDRYSQDNPELTKFLRIIELGLCGIAFYSGLHWGRMLTGKGNGAGAIGQTEMASLQTAQRVRVYVGGNGSKLLTWCGRGRFGELAPIYKAFSASLTRGVAVAAPGVPVKRVEIKVSDKQKQEVAYGLVMSGSDTQKSPDYTLPMAGESFVLADGQQKMWSDPLDLATLRGGAVQIGDLQKPGDAGGKRLPVFSAFLESVSEPADEDELEDIAREVNQILADKHSELIKTMPKAEGGHGGGNKVRIEPVFFIALKHLIEKKIEAIKTAG